MTLLGYGGVLELSREWPEPMALSHDALNYLSSPRTITFGNQDYWTGDRVLLYFPDGSPYSDVNASGSGVYYGSISTLSNARLHVTALDDQYYQVDNNAPFYDDAATVYISSGYINIDPLGRIRLFATEIGAHNSIAADEILLRNFATGNFVVARYSSAAAYISAIEEAGNDIADIVLPADSQELRNVIEVPDGITAISGSADERGWIFQADLREWSLNIDASSLDVTAIGEVFGENVKAIARGAGSLQFVVDHRSSENGQDALAVLRLTLLTQQYCKTSAKFFIYRDRNGNCDDIAGSAYYESNLLLTNSSLNVRFDDVIAGSSDFVATGEIRLKLSA